jgi:hypothetical protein
MMSSSSTCSKEVFQAIPQHFKEIGERDMSVQLYYRVWSAAIGVPHLAIAR